MTGHEVCERTRQVTGISNQPIRSCRPDPLRTLEVAVDSGTFLQDSEAASSNQEVPGNEPGERQGTDPGRVHRVPTRAHPKVFDEEQYLGARCHGRDRDAATAQGAADAALGATPPRNSLLQRLSVGAQPMK